MIVQMKKGNNRRLLENQFRFWGSGTPEDVDSTPEYFDAVAGDIVDLNMGDPISSVGNEFECYLGNALKAYCFARFKALGVEKTVLPNGITRHALLWRRITDWQTVDLEGEKQLRAGIIANRVVPEPEPLPEPENKGVTVRWNVSKRQHEVRMDASTVFASRDKEEAEAKAAELRREKEAA